MTLADIRRLSRRLAAAEERVDELRAERDAAIIASTDTLRAIAEAAGISHVAVHAIRQRADENGINPPDG